MISTINYNGISNEDIFQACFMVEGSKEVFLIHEFIKEKKCDYVVIGKLKNNSKTNLSGVNYLDWVINVNKAIKNYKYKSQPNSIIIEKTSLEPSTMKQA